VYVCMLAYTSGMGRAIASKFAGHLRGTPRIILGAKNLGVVGTGPKNLHCTGIGLLGILGSPSLQPWAALATGWPCRWRHYTLHCLIEWL